MQVPAEVSHRQIRRRSLCRHCRHYSIPRCNSRKNTVSRRSSAHTVATGLADPRDIDLELALAALEQIVRDEVESLDLTERQWETLGQIARQDAIQPKHYDDLNLNNPKSSGKYLGQFLDLKLPDRTREGRETIYKPRGGVKLYFRESPTDSQMS